jgi:hypothetical protein
LAAPRRISTAASIIASAILFAIGVIVVSLSVRTLVLFASNADIFNLAASIEKGSLPDADYLARFVGSTRFVGSNGLDRASTDCGDPFTRASLTVNLAAFDAATKTIDVPLADAAEANAIRAAEHRLECNPLDGNAWLHYAMLEARGKGPVASVIDALRVSYWTAPSEGWIIEPRLAFATNLTLAGVTGFETEYLDDLRRFASFESTSRVAAAFVAVASKLRTQMRPLIDAQPQARKKAIVAEIDRLGVDYTRQEAQ